MKKRNIVGGALLLSIVLMLTFTDAEVSDLAQNSFCGNGICEPSESLSSCFIDCKTQDACTNCSSICPLPQSTFGDGEMPNTFESPLEADAADEIPSTDFFIDESGQFIHSVEGYTTVQLLSGYQDSKGYIIEFLEPPITNAKQSYEHNLRSLGEKLKKIEEKIESNNAQERNGLARFSKNFVPNIQRTLTSNQINSEEKSVEQKIISYREDITRKHSERRQKINEITNDESAVAKQYRDTFHGISARLTPSEVKAIQSLPFVKAIHPNKKVNLSLTASVPQIQADKAWNFGLTGKGITIGIIDTGVDYTHIDLGGCLGSNCKVIGGYDFVNKDNNPMDDYGHGTHVAAIAAGKSTGSYSAPLPSNCSNYAEVCSKDTADFYCANFCVAGTDVDCCINIGACMVSQSWGVGCYTNKNPENSCLYCNSAKSQLTWSRSATCAVGTCGDGVCDGNENNQTCPTDCKFRTCIPRTTIPNATTLNGVAPDAKIVAYKVLSQSGSGYESDIIAAIEKSIDPNGDGNYDDHLDIISMSLGADCYFYTPEQCGPDDAMSKAIDNAVENGVIAVIAAGNSGAPESISSPGTARKAITVGAVDKSNALAYFSSQGPTVVSAVKPEVTAPGVNICAAQYGNWLSNYRCIDAKHIAISGTSMATPHVAGLGAILLEKSPTLSPQEIKSIIMASAQNGGYVVGSQGAGRVDALEAVNAARVITPNPLTFAINTPTNAITLSVPITIKKLSEIPYTYTVSGVNENSNIIVAPTPTTISDDTTSLGITFKSANGAQIPDGTSGGVLIFTINEQPSKKLRVPYSLVVESTPPVISVTGQKEVLIGNSLSQLIGLITDDMATIELFYRKIGTTQFLSSNSSVLQKVHFLSLQDFTGDSGTYEYYVTAKNRAGLVSVNDNNGAYYQFIKSSTTLIPSTAFARKSGLPSAKNIFSFSPEADLDNDGKREIIFIKEAANFGNTEFNIYESTGDNTYALAHTLLPHLNASEFTSFYVVGIGDSDNDGLSELVVYGRIINDFYVRIYESQTPNSYPTVKSWEDPDVWWAVGAKIADTDRDGKKEIVVAGQTINYAKHISVYENIGNNQYRLTGRQEYSYSEMNTAQSMEVADDLDNDGKPEILFGGLLTDDKGSNRIYMLENTGDNSYAPVWSTNVLDKDEFGYDQIINLQHLLYLGDSDGDGKKEFLAGGIRTVPYLGAPMYVVYKIFEATGDNSYSPVWKTQIYMKSFWDDNYVTAADIDNDNKKEIFIKVSGYLSNSAYVFKNTADNTYQPIWSQVTQGRPAIGVGDIDKDGYTELFTSDNGGTGVYELASLPSSENYYYYNLTDNQCTVNLTIYAASGNATLYAKTTSDACTDVWNQNIVAAAGQTKSMILTGLNAGRYALKVISSGTYTLTKKSNCLQDITPPAITSLTKIPPVTNQSIEITATVSDTNGLGQCEVCVSTDGTCDTEWTVQGIKKNFKAGDTSGSCSYILNTSTYNNNNYYLNLLIKDVGSNTIYGIPQSIYIDTVKPSIQKINIPSVIEKNSSFAIAVEVRDNYGVRNVSVQVQTATAPLSKNNATGMFEGTLRAPASTGEYPLILAATDAAGNTVTEVSQLLVTEQLKWSKEAPLTLDEFRSVNPALTTDTAKNKHLVWEDYKDGNSEIYYSKIDSSGRLAVFGKRLTQNIYNSKSPGIAGDSANRLHVVWQDDRDGNKEIYYTQLNTLGAVTIPQKRITFNTFNSESPLVFADTANNVHVLWRDDRDGQFNLYYKKLDSQAAVLISDTKIVAEPLTRFEVSLHANTLHIIYETLGYELKYLTLKIDGSYSPPFPLLNGVSFASIDVAGTTGRIDIAYQSTTNFIGLLGFEQGNLSLPKFHKNISNTTNAFQPSITHDTSGNIHLSWIEKDETSSTLFYSSRDSFGNSIVPPLAVFENTTAANRPKIISGSLHILFEDTPKNVPEIFLKTTVFDTVPPTLSQPLIDDIREYSATVRWQTDKPTTGSLWYGPNTTLSTQLKDTALGTTHTITIPNLLPKTTYYFEIVSEDIYGNLHKSSSVAPLYQLATKATRNKPALPTTFYGRVVFTNQTPASDITVTATWIDTDDTLHTTVTKTLSPQEAQALNDTSLVGYYLFNLGNIYAKLGSTISITTQGMTNAVPLTILANPGGNAAAVSGGPLAIDMYPPVITIHSPLQTTYTTASLSLRYSTNEEITSAEFVLNNQEPVSITNLQNQNISITAREGENTLTVSATDKSGLQASKTIQFTVRDSVPPVVVVRSSGKVKNTTTLTANVSDTTNALSQSCEVCISADGTCDTEWQQAQNQFASGDSKGMCGYLWNTLLFIDGTYTINFRVRDVSNNLGTGIPSLIAVDNTAPPSINNVAVTSLPQTTSLDIRWQQSSAPDTVKYRLYRSLNSFNKISQAARIAEITPKETVSYRDGNLLEKTIYYYAVTALDDSGNEQSDVFSVSGTVADNTGPVISITSPQSQSYAQTSVPLTFSASEAVSWCGYSLDNAPNVTATSPATLTVSEGAHTVIVYCRDTSGNSGRSLAVSFSVDISAPSPLQITSLVQQGTSILVSWQQSSAPDFKSYQLYRKETSFTDVRGLTPIQTVLSQITTAATDSSITDGKTYYYAVTAKDTLGLENTQVTSLPIGTQDKTPPPLLTNVKAVHIAGQPKILVNWDSTSAQDFSGYNIYKSDTQFDNRLNATKIATIPTKSQTSFEDTAVAELRTYYYAVTAQDTSGNELLYVAAVPGTVGDLTPPEISLLLPTQNATYQNPVPLSFKSSERPSACRYRLNTDAPANLDVSGFSCTKIIGGYDFYNKDITPQDDHGHGTHVAATAAGNGVLKGIAPDAKILVYKVLGPSGSGSFSDMILAVDRAIADGADILSLSLGGGGDPDSPWAVAMDNAYNAGVLPVVAAGNSGPSSETIGCPGCARNALTVGATTKTDLIADFSSRGPTKIMQAKPELSAPGVSICAAQWNGWLDSKQCLDTEHIAIDGTSMATPHVAGAAALVMQAHPEWSVGEVAAALKETSIDLNRPINSQGSGRINVYNAITTPAIALPSTLNLGLLNYQDDVWTKTEKLIIKNTGARTETFTIVPPTSPVGISVTANPQSVTLLPSQTAVVDVTVSVTKNQIADGDYDGDIKIQSTQNSIRVPYYFKKSSVLQMQFSSAPRSIYLFGKTSDGKSFSTLKYSPAITETFLVPKGTYHAIIEFSGSKYYFKENMIAQEFLPVSINEAEIQNKVTFRFKDKDGIDKTPLYFVGWYSVIHESGYMLSTSVQFPNIWLNTFDSSFKITLAPTIVNAGVLYDPRFALSAGLNQSIVLENDYQNFAPLTYTFQGAENSDTLHLGNGMCYYSTGFSFCIYYSLPSQGANNPYQQLQTPFTRLGYSNAHPDSSNQYFRVHTKGDLFVSPYEKYLFDSGMVLRANNTFFVTTFPVNYSDTFKTKTLPGNTHTIQVQKIAGTQASLGMFSINILDSETGAKKQCDYDFTPGNAIASADAQCNELLASLNIMGDTVEQQKRISIFTAPEQNSFDTLFAITQNEKLSEAQKQILLHSPGQKQHKVIVELKEKPQIAGGNTGVILAEQSTVLEPLRQRGIAIDKTFSASFNGFSVRVSDRDITELLKNPNVKKIYPDAEVTAVLTDTPAIINATAAWKRTDALFQNITGKGVTIAVIDTGIDYNHVDFSVCNDVPTYPVSGRDGVNQLTVSCDDSSGNTGNSLPLTFTVDASPPPPPENIDITYNSGTSEVVLQWDASTAGDFKEYHVYESITPFNTAEQSLRIAAITDRQTTQFKKTVSADGTTRYYSVTALDNFNNEITNVTSQQIILPDTIAPQIIINEPRNTTYATQSVLLSYSANEPVINCTYSLSGGPNTALIQNPATITAPDGQNTITVSCRDASGNIGTSALQAFSIDSTPPSAVQGLSVAQGNDSASFQLSWPASSDFDVAYYNVYRGLIDFTHVSSATRIASVNAQGYIDRFVAVGTRYYYAVTAVDFVGNEQPDVRTESRVLTDSTPPLITILEPRQGGSYNSKNITLQFSAQDSGGIANCSLVLNNIITEKINSPALVSGNEGANSLMVLCSDFSGNRAQSPPVLFSIDSVTPPPVLGLAVTAVPQTTTLIATWQKSTAADVKEYRVYRLTSNFSTVADVFLVQTTNQTNFTRTGLISEQIYYTAVTAVDFAGNENKNVIAVPAVTADVNPPGLVVISDVAGIPNTTSMQITWPPRYEPDMSHYVIYRSAVAFSRTYEATKAGNTTNSSFIDKGLESQKQYWYGVSAVDRNGNFDTRVLVLPGTTADLAPPNISITSPTSTKYATRTIPLSYSTSEEVLSCRSSLNSAAFMPIAQTITAAEGDNTVVVQCTDTGGNIGFSPVKTFSVDTTPPLQISGLTLTPTGPTAGFILNWNARPPSEGAVLYKIYRLLSAFSDVSSLVALASVQGTSFTDGNLQSDTTYYYAVTAVDDVGNENKQVQSIFGKTKDTAIPLVTIVSPVAKLYGNLTITIAYTVNEPTGGCTYRLNSQPQLPINGSLQVQGRQGNNFVNLSCTDLSGNTGIAAVAFTIDTQPPPPIKSLTVTPISGQTALRLNWNATGISDLSHYAIYRASSPFTDVSQMAALVSPYTGTQYTDTSVASSQTYYYAVTAVDSFGYENKSVSSVGATVDDVTPPQQVVGLNVVRTISGIGLQLNWSRNLDTDFAYYKIYRAQSGFTDVSALTPIAVNLTQISFTDYAVSDGTTYSYGVTGVDTHGNENKKVVSINATTVDLTSPAVSVNTLDSRVSGVVSISAIVSDSGVGLAPSCEVCLSTDGVCDSEWSFANVQNNFNPSDKTGTCSFSWDTTSYERGPYWYTMRVKDADNNLGGGVLLWTEVVNASNRRTVAIPLSSGWNLISLSVTPDNVAPAAVLSSIQGGFTKVYYYDTLTNTWLIYNPQRTIFDQPNTLTEMRPGRGYWIEAVAPVTLTVVGSEVVNYELQLEAGWNYIGYPYLGKKNISDGLQSLGNSYQKVYAYSAGQNSWEVYNPIPTIYEPNTLFELEEGRGYLIDMNQRVVWRP